MKIFISYRRDDSAGYAGRLFDYLSARFGSGNVFMDIDTIEPGDDFRKVVQDAVASCDVVLVMIGKQWLSMTDGPEGYFSFCPDFNAFDEQYERCLNPTPIPDEDAFPTFNRTPLPVRVVSTGESVDIYVDGKILASEPVNARIENFQFYVYAEQEGTLQGIIDDLYVTYVNE